MSGFQAFIKYLIFAIGVFEFLMVAKLLMGKPEELKKESPLYPPIFFEDFTVRCLLTLMTLFLGLVRVMWSRGRNDVFSWLYIILTHIGEAVFFWTMAHQSHFNVENLPSDRLIEKIFKCQIGNNMSTFILSFVPFVVLLLIIHGPNLNKGENKKKSE